RLTCLIRNVDGGIVSFANGYSPAEAADGAVYRANIVLARTGQLRREHTTPDAEEE
ncbi:MAG: hypothetical protein GY820_00045, partial [Gammaproteobacteria bacterium]|nr:hypothetical protein [Gammaproteobacteria bacterium]